MSFPTAPQLTTATIAGVDSDDSDEDDDDYAPVKSGYFIQILTGLPH